MLGRTLTETVNGRTTTYAYDPLGRVIRRTTPSGLTSTWSWLTGLRVRRLGPRDRAASGRRRQAHPVLGHQSPPHRVNAIGPFERLGPPPPTPHLCLPRGWSSHRDP
ncbi:RHS repeat domain-containing protein [Streptomyces goshikiensis]|uniref:RHS repeat domain-containing protein n=1 Tax=Streptomyces goshikiensis TaxID=1942 RepID=UPI003669DAB9